MIPLYKPFIPPQDELFALWKEVLDSGYIAMGDYVDEFERQFGDFIDYHHVVATGSCTHALQLALHLSGVGPGDEVISTPITAEPTNIAIYHTGARIVWADVNSYTGNIDWDDVLEKITPHTKAVMFVDYMGLPAHDYAMYEVPPCIMLIEDAAHALGASWEGRKVGSEYVDACCFSFQAIKALTTGNGGMLSLVGDVDRAKRLRWFGFDRNADRMAYNIEEAGWKWDMTNLQAAMGIVGLKYVVGNIARQRENAIYYFKHIGGPLDHIYDSSSWWTYTIFPNDREKLEAKLAAAGIGHSRGHRRNDEHPIFGGVADLPGVEAYTNHCLHIPCGWWVTDEDRERIVDVINS